MNCTGQLDFCLLCYSNSCNDDGNFFFFFVLFDCICCSFYFYGKKSTLVARFYKNKSPTTRCVEKLIILIFWIMDNLESIFLVFKKKLST